MRFQIGTAIYRVRVCRGPLLVDGLAAGAVTHKGSILLTGEIMPRDRIDVLCEHLRRLYVHRYGSINDDAIGGFTADVVRQLERQGGERALMRLRPTPTKKRPGRKQDLRRGKTKAARSRAS